MDGTTQGMIASSIGIVLFLMGYVKGSRTASKRTLDVIIMLGLLDINEKGQLVAGPKLKNK
jgi:hypothetical protein